MRHNGPCSLKVRAKAEPPRQKIRFPSGDYLRLSWCLKRRVRHRAQITSTGPIAISFFRHDVQWQPMRPEVTQGQRMALELMRSLQQNQNTKLTKKNHNEHAPHNKTNPRSRKIPNNKEDAPSIHKIHIAPPSRRHNHRIPAWQESGRETNGPINQSASNAEFPPTPRASFAFPQPPWSCSNQRPSRFAYKKITRPPARQLALPPLRAINIIARGAAFSPKLPLATERLYSSHSIQRVYK